MPRPYYSPFTLQEVLPLSPHRVPEQLSHLLMFASFPRNTNFARVCRSKSEDTNVMTHFCANFLPINSVVFTASACIKIYFLRSPVQQLKIHPERTNQTKYQISFYRPNVPARFVPIN